MLCKITAALNNSYSRVPEIEGILLWLRNHRLLFYKEGAQENRTFKKLPKNNVCFAPPLFFDFMKFAYPISKNRKTVFGDTLYYFCGQ